MAEINAGNLYDMNKSLVAQYEKNLKGKALQNRIDKEVVPYLQEKMAHEPYFMLLCNERRDYTVFHISENTPNAIDSIINNLKVCLLTRGAIYGIDRTSDGVALELWIKGDDNGEMACYYFFPYTQAVIEI